MLLRLLEPDRNYKGCGGRIGVIGGSREFVGAPYYACMAILKSGGELVSLKSTDKSCTD